MSTATLPVSVPELRKEFDQLPMETDEALYEFVNGRRVEVPAMSMRPGRVANRLAWKLSTFAEANQLGEVNVEFLVRLPLAEDPSRYRRPDVSFFCYPESDKDPLQESDVNACPVVPDLAVEVTSPTDRAEDQRAKVLEYFRAGVRCVWMIYPRLQIVDVHDSPTSIRVFGVNDTLVGDPVLPGFQLRLAELFNPFARPKS